MMRAATPDPANTGRIEIVSTPVPVPRPTEVLVRVCAAGMNRADLLHAAGSYGQRAFGSSDRPNIAGMEVAGRVVALGPEVGGISVGVSVMAMCSGAYADYVAVDQSLLMPAPARLSFIEAASLPMALLTEYEALVRLAEVRAGERILVTGATSGVGLIGVQLARVLGPRALVATSRSSDADSLLTALGADHVTHSEDELALLVGADGIDVVIDHVGGEVFEAAIEHLRKGARIVSVGRLGARTASVNLAKLAAKRARVIGTTWRTQTLPEIAKTTALVRDEVLPAVDDSRITPVLGATVDFDDIARGYKRLKDGRQPGKLVVALDQS